MLLGCCVMVSCWSQCRPNSAFGWSCTTLYATIRIDGGPQSSLAPLFHGLKSFGAPAVKTQSTTTIIMHEQRLKNDKLQSSCCLLKLFLQIKWSVAAVKQGSPHKMGPEGEQRHCRGACGLVGLMQCLLTRVLLCATGAPWRTASPTTAQPASPKPGKLWSSWRWRPAWTG